MKLIKINTNHYVVVDETIQPVNGYYYDSFINKIKNTNGADYEEASHCWQITHSTKRLEDYFSSAIYTNYLPISLQEVKELIGEVDVEKKAELYVWGGVYLTEQEKQQTEIAYMTGYNQALEDNKEKKYTEEDIKKIRQILVEGAITNMSCSSAVVELDKYIQSLQPKTEWEVEIVDGKLKLKL